MEMDTDGNRKARLCVILFFAAVLFVCVFLCFASLVTSVGYKQSLAAEFAVREVMAFEKTEHTFVIDPGHGGEDPGCVSGGHTEKTINLAVSLYLEDFFALSENDVVLTRRDDRLLYADGQENRKKFFDLRNRLDIAENAKNGVYIGIHVNKFPESRYSGLQTFYSDNVSQSEPLAQSIQECARLLDPQNKRSVRPDGDTIYILEKITVPAVLVECGFISNEKEAKLLEDEGYQKRLAFAVFCGVMRWLGGQDEN
ncbi:MAG: N-acetylmuramoyl-L-alanine amidase [Clostridia bacterium]|nr:N-acetylmuramoyl-L-alanine amidase [Clostridia bacterium]